MGKLGKKMAKNQKKNQEVQLQEEMNPLKRTMKEQIDEEKFADAIETMAELAKLKCMDPEVMYDGAYSYFMLGDYERAANWINNTLTYKPDHMMARVLLARLCLLEERTEDGLAIFDFVLEHYLDVLPDETQEEIEEILEYYGRNEADKLRRRYPHIAAFLKLDNAAAEEPAPIAEQEPSKEDTKKEAEPLAKAQAAVAALKTLMSRTKAPEEKKVEPSETTQKESVSDSAAEKVQPAEGILQQSVSAAEKIRLLHIKAGRAFVNNHLAEAQSLLQAAMELDSCNDVTLRSLAVAAIAGGDRTKAIEYAMRMTNIDFLLLDRLRVH